MKPQPPAPWAGPTRQPAARDRTRTADPRDPDERLQHRKRSGPAPAPHYARGDDEARAQLREAFTLSGDLQITHHTIPVRLDPASASRRSNAPAALCVELTDTATRYPGTDLTLAYSIKGHSATK